MNTKRFFAHITEVIDIAGVIQFRRGLFKLNIGEKFGQAVVDDGFLPLIAIKGAINRKIMNVGDAVFASKFIEGFLPFGNNDGHDFLI